MGSFWNERSKEGTKEESDLRLPSPFDLHVHLAPPFHLSLTAPQARLKARLAPSLPSQATPTPPCLLVPPTAHPSFPSFRIELPASLLPSLPLPPYPFSRLLLHFLRTNISTPVLTSTRSSSLSTCSSSAASSDSRSSSALLLPWRPGQQVSWTTSTTPPGASTEQRSRTSQGFRCFGGVGL